MKTNQGFTLVELMVVVIVIGILSALATVGYKVYMDQARATRLKAYVVSLGAKQMDAMSRQVAVPFSPGVYSDTTKAAYQNVLGFSETVYPDVTVETGAWNASTPAGNRCPRCGQYGIPVPTSVTGFYAYAVQQMTPGGNPTVIYMTNETPGPVEMNVGE